MNEDTKRCTSSLDSDYVEFAAEVFRLLSDSTRVRLILVLREGEKSVNDLAELVHKTPTAVSQHLAKLRWGKIVSPRQEGNKVFYSLTNEDARELVSLAVFQASRMMGEIPTHPRCPHSRREFGEG